MHKILTGFIGCLLSTVALGTTLNPIQLLNPTGSANGQAIVSTGASTAPAWGGVGLNGIAPISANTVLANATASSAAPTAFAMSSCSTSVSALNWTTSTGFTCNTGLITAATVASTYAPLASPTFTGTLTANAVSVTGNFSPSQTAGIIGTTTNNNANAGSVGEFISSTVASGSAVSLGSGTPTNITSISLTAGDWDVWGETITLPAGSTTTSNTQGWVNTVSASAPSTGLGAYFQYSYAGAAGGVIAGQTGILRVSLASTTTVYLSTQVTFAVSTCGAYGYIAARRIR